MGMYMWAWARAWPLAATQGCSLADALRKPELYLFWLAHYAGTGPGLMVLSNIAQIAQAQVGAFTDERQTACYTYADYDRIASAFVVLCGGSNCVGRLLGGFVSDRFRTPSRPAWFGIFLLIMSASLLAMSLVQTLGALCVCCLTCFVAYGAFWSVKPPARFIPASTSRETVRSTRIVLASFRPCNPASIRPTSSSFSPRTHTATRLPSARSLMPVLTAEIVGEKNLGTVYNIMSLAPAASVYVNTVLLASSVYAAHTPPHAPQLCAETVGMADGKCFGRECYGLTLRLTAGLGLLGAACALVLAWRMRFFYAGGGRDEPTRFEGVTTRA